jgi:demethylmenaquinone methyltransferase/2-methoxy-6-polyprenyl-1,4-benzoquinol methylase
MDEPSNKTEMLAKYRKFSLIYDNVFRALENLVFWKDAQNPRLALVRSVSKKSRLSVLDFCCGTGNGALAVAEVSREVVGIDLSPHMLSNADKKMRKRGIRNVTFREMDAARMEFDDESFDLATVSFGLHEMELDLMLRVLKESGRVLKRGGELLIVDYGREEGWLEPVLSIYLKISYPKHVLTFLDYDWKSILTGAGFRLDGVERYRISQLVSATKGE